MNSWDNNRAQQWRAKLLSRLENRIRNSNSVGLALVRVSAVRAGGVAPSLLEQEGLTARAMACIELTASFPIAVEPLSPHSFAIVIEGAPSLETLSALISEIQAIALKQLNLDSAYVAKATIGVASAPQHATDAASLLDAADAALVCVKQEGAVATYSTRARDEAKARQDLTMRLRYAIQNEELELHYQPQVDPHTGRPITFEALVRWNHAGQQLAPGEFFPLATDDFLLELGEWTLRESLHQLRRWRDQGFRIPRVSTNLIAEQLEGGDLVGMTRSALRHSCLEPDALEVELVESHLVEFFDRGSTALESLRQLGVRVAIDDFGTGYSSLAYLKHLSVDVLKIDRSIAADVVSSPISCSIVESVSTLAKALGMATVAEGVEREDQFLRLASLGCERLQGYWIARPANAELCTAWLSQHTPRRRRASSRQ